MHLIISTSLLYHVYLISSTYEVNLHYSSFCVTLKNNIAQLFFSKCIQCNREKEWKQEKMREKHSIQNMIVAFICKVHASSMMYLRKSGSFQALNCAVVKDVILQSNILTVPPCITDDSHFLLFDEICSPLKKILCSTKSWHNYRWKHCHLGYRTLMLSQL